MANILKINDDKTFDFGNYENKDKLKEAIIHNELDYKVKTHSDITRLERDELMIYESVPGTNVRNFSYTSSKIKFNVSGYSHTSIIIGVNQDSVFNLTVDNVDEGEAIFVAKGKLNINLNLENNEEVSVELTKIN